MINEESNKKLTDQIKALRRALAAELGFVMPSIRIQDNMQLPANEYNIYIKEGTYTGVGNTNLTVNGNYFINFIGDGADKTIIDGQLNYTINPNPGFVWGSSQTWWPWVNTTGNWFMNITAGNGTFEVSDFRVQNCYSPSGSSIAACNAATIDNYANLKARQQTYTSIITQQVVVQV